MKIKAFTDFHVPGIPAFKAGMERVVTDSLAKIFLDRGLAEEIKIVKPKEEEKKNEEKEEKKK